jgi:hypothetical protein
MNSKVASVLLYISLSSHSVCVSCRLPDDHVILMGGQVIDYWFSFPVGSRCILVLVNLCLLSLYHFRLRSLNSIATRKFHVPYMID